MTTTAPTPLLDFHQKKVTRIQEEGFAALADPNLARELVLASRYVNPSSHPVLKAARKLFADLPQVGDARVELFSIGGEDDDHGVNIKLPYRGKAIVSLPRNIDQIADAFNMVYPAFRITITTGSSDLAQGRIKRYASRGGVYTAAPQFSTRESFPFDTLSEALDEAVKNLDRGMFPYEGEVEFRFTA